MQKRFKRHAKKTLSLLVTLAMLVAMVPGALAAKTTGEQTESVNGLLTLTIDGVEVPLDTEIPAGAEAVLTGTNYLQSNGKTVGKLSGAANGTARPYRTALFVDGGAFVAEKSVTDAVQNNGKTAAYDGSSIENVSVSAGTTGFSGMILNDAGTYTVKDSKVVLNTGSDGTDANDFSGYGSAVAVFGDTNATIEGAEIETTGVAVSGLVVDGGADVVLKDSTITTHGGTIYSKYQQTSATDTMIAPPWDLGLTGNVRAVNVMGTEGTFTMVDSTINAANWAGVSTDGATRLRITGINSKINMADSGYGVLSIGQGTQIDLYGMDIDAETFLGVYMDTSTINISGSEAKSYPIYSLKEGGAGETHAASQDNMDDLVATIAIGEPKTSRLTSDSFGFMFNVMMGSGSKINYLNLGSNVEMETGNAAFLAKSDGANIVVDGAQITVKDGVLLQAMDNPGASIGLAGGQTLNTTYEEPEGWSSEWGEAVKHGKRLPTDLTLKNTDIAGSVYNGTGYDKDGQGGAQVNVTIGKNASLTGALASTEVMHSTDGGNTQNAKIAYLEEGEGYDHDTVKEAAHKLNYVANKPYFNGYNAVNVTVEDGGQWVVTEDSMVNDVTVDSGSAITAEKPVTITVYGTLTLGKNTYTYGEDSDNEVKVDNVTYKLVENDMTGEIEPDEGGSGGEFPGGDGFPGGGYNPPETADDMADPHYAYMTLEHVTSVKVTDTIANVNGLEVEGIDNKTPVAAAVTVRASAGDKDPDNGSTGGSSGGSATYAISLADSSNGAVKIDPSRASKGATVTLTVTPDAGYALSALTVTTADGGAVSLTKKSDTRYTFTMPASKITVKAVFQPEAGETPTAFTDVEAGSYYEEAVQWAVAQNVTAGTGALTFSPDAVCTRAQMVTFLWRAAGSPAPTSTAHPFTDVEEGGYYYQAMLWAVEQGITTGTGAAAFSPDVVCTRAQTVTFLWRASGAPAAEGASHPFTDVETGSYYEQSVIWAVEQGITAGTGAAAFSPGHDCTRAQIVTFLYRAFA